MKPLFPVGRRFLVWLVASVASFESGLQAISAAFHRVVPDVFVWGFGAVGLFLAAAFVERVKTLEEG